jgi:hypothetical protein
MKFLLTVLFCVLTSNVTAANIDVKTYIPPQAFKYFDIIKDEQRKIIPDFPYTNYWAGLAEHESCISLTHKRCWSPTSQLKTKRENGAGLFQITRTFNPDGSIRFDVLSDMKKQHLDLKELSWNNVLSRPDLQIRAMMIMSKTNYNMFNKVTSTYDRMAMMDAAYNGGAGSVKKRRLKCGLTKNCDPQLWFDNIENMVVKSTKPMYGGRSAQEINNHHVEDVLTTRMRKYEPYF